MKKIQRKRSITIIASNIALIIILSATIFTINTGDRSKDKGKEQTTSNPADPVKILSILDSKYDQLIALWKAEQVERNTPSYLISTTNKLGQELNVIVARSIYRVNQMQKIAKEYSSSEGNGNYDPKKLSAILSKIKDIDSNILRAEKLIKNIEEVHNIDQKYLQMRPQIVQEESIDIVMIDRKIHSLIAANETKAAMETLEIIEKELRAYGKTN